MASSAWVNVSAQDVVGLQDIMLEEKLHLKETKKVQKSSVTNKAEKCSISEEIVTPFNGEEDLLSDEEIARLLQQQFNEECKALKDYKNSFNKTVNIPILCSGSKADQHNLDMQADSEDEENNEDFRDHKDWDQSDMAKKEINKHDNGLKLQWKQYETVTDFGLDEYNSMQLHKMIKNQTLIHRVNYVMRKGQNAVLLHAECNKSKECVIKVFTLTEIEFKKRARFYAENKRISKARFYRRNINILAEKEMLNLIRLKKAGILCPEVLAVKHDMLIMSFIGQDRHCAPPLKFTNLTVNEYISAYHQVVEAMKSLFNIARLIHTDLSECSILWHNKQCYFIDVSQAVELSTEAFIFLFEDCKNISKFFTSKSLPDIMTAEELFMEITGCDYNDRIEGSGVQTFNHGVSIARTDDVNVHDATAKQEIKFAEHNT